MKHIAVSSQVARSPEAVFGTVRDFSNYAAYSERLAEVSVEGDGTPGTEYVLDVRVLGRSVGVRTRLDRVDPPRLIEWSVLGSVQAGGRWNVRPAEDGTGTTLELVLEYDLESVDSSLVSLPFGISFEWLTNRAESLAKREAETVLERIGTELENGVE